MKKKKKHGKKRFRRFFWKRFLVCLLLGGLLVAYQIGRMRIDRWKLQEWKSFNMFIPAIVSMSEKGWNKYDAEGRLSDALALISDNKANEEAALLYQPETGEFYTGAPFAQAYTWQDGELRTYTLRDQTLIDRLDDTAGHFSLYYCSYIVYSIYVKNDQFVPGEVFMQKKTVFPLTRFQKAGEPVRGEWINLSPQNTEGWTKVCSDCSKEELTVYPDWNNWSSLTYEPDYGTRNETARKKSADGNTYLGNVTVTGSPNAPKAAAFTEAMGTKLPAFYEALRKEEKEKLDIAERGNLSAEMLLEWKAENQQEAIKHIKKHYTKRFNSLPETVFNDVRERGFSPMDYGPLILLPDNSFELRSEEVEFRDQTWELFHFEYMDPRLAVLNLIMLFLLPCIFVLILLCIAAALLWSVIAYLLYSRRYDLEAYRKNLTGVLAHDLKTPLAVIYGNAENLRAHTHPEQADEYADRIMENVTHIDEMIAGVLGLAQLENGVMPERKETVDLTALLHTAFQRSADQMAQRGLTLTESGKMEIRGNTEMLTQLAENLAANAVQHAAEGGTITVTAEKKVLRICNPYTGELDEKAICEPFRRGDAARGMHSGSGLGLSIVQQIAALQKLRLRVTARDGVFTAELKRRR